MSPLLKRTPGILLRGLLHAIDLFSEPLFHNILGTYVLLHSKAQWSIDPDKTTIKKDTCTPTFIAALFIIAKMWKNLNAHQQMNG